MFDESKIKFNDPVSHKNAYLLWGQPRPKDFFNRDNQEQMALSALRNPNSRKPVVIIGERRSGKTSMLKLLTERLKDEFAILDIHSRGVDSASAFFSSFEQELAELLKLKQSPEPSKKTEDQIIARLQAYYRGFRSPTAVPADDKKPLLILIDEVDVITDKDLLAKDDQERIALFLQRLIDRDDTPVKFLFSVTHEMKEERGDVPSLLTDVTSIPMPPFSEKDARDMVRSMVKEDVTWNEVEQHLDWKRFCRLSGCWPYYMKALLMHLALSWPSLGGDSWLDVALSGLLNDVGFQQTAEHLYVKHFDDEERDVLLRMVRSGGRINEASLASIEGLLPAAKRLVKRFYLNRKDDAIVFRVGVLEQWLARGPFRE